MSDNTITYRVEKLKDILEELKPLVEAHFEEVRVILDDMRFSPNYDKYLLLEDLGTLKIITLRVDNKLEGYLIVLVEEYLHCKGVLFSAEEGLYISPEYRDMGLGKEILKHSEEYLKSIGVSIINMNTRVVYPIDNLLESSGYTYVERVYSKHIGDK